MAALSPADAASALLKRREVRRSLGAWARYKGFVPARHHQVILDAIEEFLLSDEEVLLLFAPPGSAKSTYVSILLPSWYLANHPEHSILAATHSVEFAERWGRRVRNDIALDAKTLGIELSADSQAAARWSLATGGEYYGVGAGVGISGFRADLGLGDDFFGSREDAYSETVRKKRWDWYVDDYSARLKPGAKRILMNCMTGDTPVTMADGTLKRLEKIKVGDYVVSWEGGRAKTSRVLNWVEQGEDDIIEIRTGGNRVRANARHPFLVERGWIKAGDLKLGDKLVTLSRLESCGRRLTERSAWLLGYMFGDGWVTVRDTTQKGYKGRTYPRRGFVTCVAHAVAQDENEEVADAFSEVVGVRPKPTPFGYSRTDVAAVGRWFMNHGLTGKAKTKRLPAWLFSECEVNRLAFLAGYNSADGYVHKNGRWTQHSVSRELIEDVRHLARGVGYRVTNVSTRVNSGQPPHSPKPVVSAISNVQWGPYRETTIFAQRTITSIKPAGRAVVYDIEVEGAGCFIADGVVSHNTRWHEEDVAGRVVQQISDGVVRGRIISIPAVAEQGDALGRKVGEYLWDDDENYPYGQFLRQRQRETSPMMWAALYQQRPAPEEGDYFKASWIKECDDKDIPPRDTMQTYGGSDYAVTADGGDFTVHMVIGLDPDFRMFVLDLWRRQASSDVWVDAFCDLVLEWKPLEWAEEKGQITSGVGPLIDRRALERKAFVARTGFPTKHDKAIRAQSIRGRMAAGGLYVPKSKPWGEALRSELLGFPAGKHDDQVDALGLIGQLLDGMVAGTTQLVPVKKIDVGYVTRKSNATPGDWVCY